MPPAKANILSTRPLNEELITEAALEGIVVDVVSFIQTEPIQTIETEQEISETFLLNTTVVFTSMNAVEAVAEYLHDVYVQWNIYCIGNTTRLLVEQYLGKELIAGTAENATELAENIIEDGEATEVIFFCGDKRRNELPELLRENDIEVTEIVVYRTITVPLAIEKNYNGILFFSPSAVKAFFQSNTINKQTVLFAIGNTTASEIEKHSNNKIVISDETSKSELLNKAITYFT